jgi:hypothetical protein
MTNEHAIAALYEFIDFKDHGDGYEDERREAARLALLTLRKSLHDAESRAEMACEQQPCGKCPGCARADELGGESMSDWKDEVPHA